MAARRDDSALLDIVGSLLGLIDLDELRPGILEALRRAVPCEFSSLTEIGPEGIVGIVTPPLDEEWHERFAKHAHENPLYRRWLETRDGRAYRFSDVCTREELEATNLYREFYGPLGVEHQVAVTVTSEPDRILALVLSREHRDFSDAECELLNRARPFLIQVYRNALAFAALRPASSPADGFAEALGREGLTPRQAEALRRVALGGSNRDIGLALGISERTVQKHLEQAFRKLGVSTRSAAAARAWELAGGDGDGAHPASDPAMRG